MSDSIYPPAPLPAPSLAVVKERVGLGLLFAVPAILAGIVVTVVLWRIGFVAGISSLITSAGSIALYQKGARTAPRLGLVPLFLMIVVGIALSFFGIVASDLWKVYGEIHRPTGYSRVGFVWHYLFDHRVLSSYSAKDYLYLVLFGALGVFGAVRRLGRA